MHTDLDQLINSVMDKKRNLDDDNSDSTDTAKSARLVKIHKLLARDDDGSLRQVKYIGTIWYKLYVKSSPCNERLLNLFRNTFRLPYGKLIDLS